MEAVAGPSLLRPSSLQGGPDYENSGQRSLHASRGEISRPDREVHQNPMTAWVRGSGQRSGSFRSASTHSPDIAGPPSFGCAHRPIPKHDPGRLSPVYNTIKLIY